MKNILVIDGDNDILKAIQEILVENCKCRVKITTSISEAKTLLKGIRYDLVILDYFMFKHNDENILAYLHDVKLIMTSTLNDCYFKNVLKKPFNIQELIDVIGV